jgi:hypothetical protein
MGTKLLCKKNIVSDILKGLAGQSYYGASSDLESQIKQIVQAAQLLIERLKLEFLVKFRAGCFVLQNIGIGTRSL